MPEDTYPSHYLAPMFGVRFPDLGFWILPAGLWADMDFGFGETGMKF